MSQLVNTTPVERFWQIPAAPYKFTKGCNRSPRTGREMANAFCQRTVFHLVIPCRQNRGSDPYSE
jgi:hypothetical protein